MSAYDIYRPAWASPEACHARALAAEHRRTAEAEAAAASAEAECDHRAIQIRDLWAAMPHIDEREAIVGLSGLVKRLRREPALPLGLLDLVSAAEAWMGQLDEEFRERLGDGHDD